MSMESLGADESVHKIFQPYAAQGLLLARVVVSQRERYQLIATAGELSAEVSGALRHRSEGPGAMPVTGDWVAVRVAGPLQTQIGSPSQRGQTQGDQLHALGRVGMSVCLFVPCME